MIDLPKGVQHKVLTRQNLWDLWETVRKFDRLFSDETRGDPIAFWKNILKDSVILETDDGGGILTLSNVKPGLRAEAHLTFWDHKLSPRIELIRDCLVWAFLNFDLYRIEVFIPVIGGPALRRFLEKLGFKKEGILRNRSWYQGQLIDTVLLSILREEILNG
jgi:RimJ/RimL family protein N-acetyltransferase